MHETERDSEEDETQEAGRVDGNQTIPKSAHITGVMVSYYFICRRKLWLFAHHIYLEQEHENVAIGRHLHEKSFSRYSKDATIDSTISIDFVRTKDGLEVHEIKKSSRMEAAHRFQTLYYLYYLAQRGVQARGVIHYPTENKKSIVELNNESKLEMENVLGEIQKVVKGTLEPPVNRKTCKKCAYEELCFGDEP